jgi:hypothetical protein
LSRHELEDEKAMAAGLLESVDGADMRVIQRCEDPRFTFEPANPIRIARQSIGRKLERDLA